MGRRGITYEQVDEAANTLEAAGTDPSTTAVRKLLRQGSNSTIGAHLARRRAKRAAEATPNIQTSLPAEIARAVTAFVNDQVARVTTAAEAAVAAERSAGAASEAEVEQLAEEIEAANTRIAELEVQVAEAAGRLKQVLSQTGEASQLLETKLAAAERRAADAEKAAAVAEARCEAAERRAVDASNREIETRAELKAKMHPAHVA